MTETRECRYPFLVDPEYKCRCHKRMGNDFYFLPSNRCLYEDEAPHGKKIQKLAQGIHLVYKRFGVADHISLLDWGVRLSWSTPPAGLDRYEEIPMDPELLHYTGGSPRSSGQIDIYLDGNELVIAGPRGKIWSRIYDMAEASAEPK